MEIATQRKKRSEKLLPEELKKLKKYVASFDTKEDCLETMHISRVTLNCVSSTRIKS